MSQKKDNTSLRSTIKNVTMETISSVSNYKEIQETAEEHMESTVYINPLPTQSEDSYQENYRDQESDGIYIVERGTLGIFHPYDNYLGMHILSNPI